MILSIDEKKKTKPIRWYLQITPLIQEICFHENSLFILFTKANHQNVKKTEGTNKTK